MQTSALKAAALLGALLLLAPETHAFITDSQYHVTTEPGELLLDSYTHWDSEASSDFIVYQRPIEWDGSWWRSTRSFDLSVGSVSSKQFLNYQRLKLYVPLSETVEFRLHWLQERDFEQDRIATPLELRFRLSEKWYLSLLGETSLYKSEDDVGIALAFKPTPSREIQISGLWGDFQRNERNLLTDKWSQAPVAWTLTSTYLPTPDDRPGAGPSDFRRTEAHYEAPSIRSNGTVDTRTLSYRSIYFSGLRTFGLGSTFGYRILADRAEDVDHSGGTNRSRFRSLNQIEYGYFAGPIKLRPGLNVFYREIHLDKDREYYREVLPVFWVDLPVKAKSWGEHAWSIGYDGTVFNRDSSRRGDDREIEHRLNLKSNMKFSKAGELALLFTFDVDRFGSGETWEGGAGQFRLEF